MTQPGHSGRTGRHRLLTQGEGHTARGHNALVGVPDEAAAVGQVVEVHVHVPDVSHPQGVERCRPGAAVVPPHHGGLGTDLPRAEPGRWHGWETPPGIDPSTPLTTGEPSPMARGEAPASLAAPYLAPGRLEVPVSSGTPTNAASSPSADACTGSLIMEQTPTGRATSRALGGTLNRELQQLGALLPGTRGWRNPEDALAGELEVARKAGGHRLWCEVVTIAVTASLGAQSPALRGSSWLQAAPSRGLILIHSFPPCPTGNAARGAVEPAPSWGRVPAASAKPPSRDQSAPDTPLPREWQKSSPACTFTLPAAPLPNGIVLANTGNKHSSEGQKPVQGLAG